MNLSPLRLPFEWLLLHIALAAAGVLAYRYNLLLIPFQNDSTFMTHGIAGLFVVGIGLSFFGRWNDVEFTANTLVTLGLLGTVVGFVMALSGVSASTVGSVEAIGPMVGNLVSAMGTALHTTLVGAVGYIWLELLRHVLGR